MEKDTKVVLGISAAAVVGWLLFFRKKAEAAILPSGQMYAEMPANVVEGDTADVGKVYVTNTSKRGGVNVAYTFRVNIQLYGPGAATPFYDLKALVGGGDAAYGMLGVICSAGQVDSMASFLFPVPVGVAGLCTAKATLYQNDGVTPVGTPVSGQFVISTAAITVGGSVRW